MNGIGWITVAEAARLCGTDELRITLWMNGNHIAYARFDGILMIDGASLAPNASPGASSSIRKSPSAATSIVVLPSSATRAERSLPTNRLPTL